MFQNFGIQNFGIVNFDFGILKPEFLNPNTVEGNLVTDPDLSHRKEPKGSEE